MRVLFTGKGTSGSWQCRGVQLGGEIGDVKPKATDFSGYDLVVLVKRPAPGQIEALKRSGIPWAWDLVDFYPQPTCTKWTRDQAIAWVKAQLKTFNPDAVIWPNQRMRDDCDDQRPGVVVYHHYRPSLAARPVSERVKVVGYEGSPQYLGRWEKAIRKACDVRSIAFTTSVHTDQMDVCVAFRDDHVNGYVQQHWKSNVKLANAHGAGIPFIGYSECGYLETAVGSEVWCSDPQEFGACLDSLTLQKRQEARLLGLTKRYPLRRAAIDLRELLKSVS